MNKKQATKVRKLRIENRRFQCDRQVLAKKETAGRMRMEYRSGTNRGDGSEILLGQGSSELGVEVSKPFFPFMTDDGICYGTPFTSCTEFPNGTCWDKK